MQVVYSPKYEVDVGPHVFIMAKYRLTRDRLLASGEFGEPDFLEPKPATDADILLAHEPAYVNKVKKGTLSDAELYALEIKYSPELKKAAWLWSGGSILAGRQALETGACYHLGGGFHHAFPDHGEGFCLINDHSVAVRRLIADGVIRLAMIIDCDVHQANGTAAIFAGESDVFTFSIHQEHNYPALRPPSDIDIGLPDEAGDAEYMEALEAGLEDAFARFYPDLIFYVAGADPYRFDQIGGLNLTVNGLRQRDERVFAKAKEKGIPVATVLAGGYAASLDDLVTIHTNTALAQKKTMNG